MSTDPTPITTECCGVAIAVDHRFCPKCGWEARIIQPPDPDPGARARSVDPWDELTRYLSVTSYGYKVSRMIAKALEAERQQSTAQQAKDREDAEVLRHSNIIEIAVRNETGSVSEYMNHWEWRALKAEAAVASLTQQLADLKAETSPRVCAEWTRSGVTCQEMVAVVRRSDELRAQVTAKDAEIARLQEKIHRMTPRIVPAVPRAMRFDEEWEADRSSDNDRAAQQIATLQSQLTEQLKISGDYWQVIETQRQELVKFRDAAESLAKMPLPGAGWLNT